MFSVQSIWLFVLAKTPLHNHAQFLFFNYQKHTGWVINLQKKLPKDDAFIYTGFPYIHICIHVCLGCAQSFLSTCRDVVKYLKPQVHYFPSKWYAGSVWISVLCSAVCTIAHTCDTVVTHFQVAIETVVAGYGLFSIMSRQKVWWPGGLEQKRRCGH